MEFKEAQQLLGWPHQRENAVSDGVVSCDLDFEGHSKFGTSV